MVAVKADCAKPANVFTAVCQAAAAGVGYFVTANRALVTCNFNNFNNVRVMTVAAHSNFNPFANDGSFLINTAACGRYVAGNYCFRYVHKVFQKPVFPGKACNLT